jgi:multidrug efflux pump subunit AcrA (membrane-fusion protein)
MKVLKIMVAVVMCGVIIFLLSCASSSTTGTQNEIATVQRGNLTVDITASGNLAYSHQENLAFETSGTVEQILVQAGDSVKEGQVLAQLDTTSLEQAVTAAERAVNSANVSLEQATNDYYKLILPNVFQTYQFILPDATTNIDFAQQRIKEAIAENQKGLTSQQYSMGDIDRLLKETRDLLSTVKTELGWFLIPSTSLDYWTLRAAQIKVDTAQSTLDSQNDALNEAKDNLTKAAVVAPFDGLITSVNVAGGDEVQKGTVAVVIADPTKFETEIMVSETDVFQVQDGAEATVQVDAMPAIVLPAKVTHISPTATIQQGVVNYGVKIEVQSLEAVATERQASQAMTPPAGMELPEGMTPPTGMGGASEQGNAATSQTSAATLDNVQLREGLTVTVSVILQQKNNVLLVPYAAITRQGGQSYVQVISSSGTTEQRAIKTGITDYKNTEVTEGLSEGEQVVVLKGTTTTTSTTTNRQERGTFFFGRP